MPTRNTYKITNDNFANQDTDVALNPIQQNEIGTFFLFEKKSRIEASKQLQLFALKSYDKQLEYQLKYNNYSTH
jgi:hypothetical protein